jgi:hypothetical protein
MRIKTQKISKGTEEQYELHALIQDVSPADIEVLDKSYQESIRNSPIFDEMVKKFGKKRAEKLLKEFKVVEIKD